MFVAATANAERSAENPVQDRKQRIAERPDNLLNRNCHYQTKTVFIRF
jgi:hypothetical protein